MSNEPSIYIKGYYDRQVGSQYAAFSYIVADLSNSRPVPEIDYYIYFAFVKLSKPFVKRDFNEGVRLTTPYRTSKKERDIASAWLAEHDIEHPSDLFEGIDENQFHTGAFEGLKQYMSMPFDSKDIVTEMALCEELYIDKTIDLLGIISDEKKKRTFERYLKREMERFSGGDSTPTQHLSLSRIIESWLKGRVNVDDLKSYFIDHSFVRGKDFLNNCWENIRDICIYDNNVKYCFGSKIHPYGFIDGGMISTEYVLERYEDAEPRYLYYYFQREGYVLDMAVKAINGESERLDNRVKPRIPRHRIDTDISNRLRKESFDIMLQGYCDSYIDAPKRNQSMSAFLRKHCMPIDFNIIQRFRNTGYILSYDDENIEQLKRNYAARCLMGLNRYIQDFNPVMDKKLRVLSLKPEYYSEEYYDFNT